MTPSWRSCSPRSLQQLGPSTIRWQRCGATSLSCAHSRGSFRSTSPSRASRNCERPAIWRKPCGRRSGPRAWRSSYRRALGKAMQAFMQPGDDIPVAPRLAHDLQIESLQRLASKGSYEGLAAQRVLEGIYVQLDLRRRRPVGSEAGCRKAVAGFIEQTRPRASVPGPQTREVAGPTPEAGGPRPLQSSGPDCSPRPASRWFQVVASAHSGFGVQARGAASRAGQRLVSGSTRQRHADDLPRLSAAEANGEQ